jgi:hypothetical protein
LKPPNNQVTEEYHFKSYLGYKQTSKQTPWPESASELYRPSDRRLLAKLVPTFADRGRRVVSETDPYGHIICSLGRLNKDMR